MVAKVRRRVDAEFELHRRHDERGGARALGIHLVVTARERHACEFAVLVIGNFTNDNESCHSLNLIKEVVYFTEAISPPE